MDTKVFYEVIVPLLEVENTALICISTPQDSMNFYSEMFTLKTPDGKVSSIVSLLLFFPLTHFRISLSSIR